GDLRALLARELRPISVDKLAGLGLTPEGSVESFDTAGDTANDAASIAANGRTVGRLQLSNAFYSCSQATADFLRQHVLRVQDLKPVQKTGWVKFDGSLGVHEIPLSVDNNGT